jgi:hypothetical protein
MEVSTRGGIHARGRLRSRVTNAPWRLAKTSCLFYAHWTVRSGEKRDLAQAGSSSTGRGDPAGESPARVGLGVPGSRLPAAVERPSVGAQARKPGQRGSEHEGRNSQKQTLQPRQSVNRNVFGRAKLAISRRRQSGVGPVRMWSRWLFPRFGGSTRARIAAEQQRQAPPRRPPLRRVPEDRNAGFGLNGGLCLQRRCTTEGSKVYNERQRHGIFADILRSDEPRRAIFDMANEQADPQWLERLWESWSQRRVSHIH